jgi:hypothetical protein
MEPQVIAAIISGSIGAFVEKLKYEVLHDYVLKEDFLREMQAVHSKLDRILDHLLNK